MQELRALGDHVRRLRRSRGLTLETLADQAGLSPRFLSDLERGRGNISIGRLLKVARALEASIAELVAPLDEPPAPAAVAGSSRRSRAEQPRPKIALIGLRGAGKSTIGKRAAERLRVPFVELDLEIETAAGVPLPQIFEIYGEAYYRRMEREVLSRVLEESKAGAIIATGGGIVMDKESWKTLKRATRTVWLKARPEEHLSRVAAQGDLRPMKNRPSAMAELRALLASRAEVYREADVVVDTSSLGLEDAVGRVCEAARR